MHRTATLKSAVGLRALGRGNSLETLLREIHHQYTTVNLRRVTFEGQVVEAAHVSHDDAGCRLHLVAYVPEDQISVVPQGVNRPSVDLILADPPAGTEYTDGDAMFFVRGNDVAICRSGLGERALITYVMELSRMLGHELADVAFDLMRRADVDKLRMIRQEGVHKISLNAVANSTSIDHIERTSVRRHVVESVWDELRALLGIEDDAPDADEAENLKVEVSLSFDKRRGTEIDKNQIEAIAERMLRDNDDEGFEIVTLSGRKIRANDIVLSKRLQLRPHGKSVAYREAWAALEEFYSELRRPRRG